MTQINADGVRRIKNVANCPHCSQPHHYVEISFPIENDQGYWEVECSHCKAPFVIELAEYSFFDSDSARKVPGRLGVASCAPELAAPQQP